MLVLRMNVIVSTEIGMKLNAKNVKGLAGDIQNMLNADPVVEQE
jgi:hypothetical protein